MQHNYVHMRDNYVYIQLDDVVSYNDNTAC